MAALAKSQEFQINNLAVADLTAAGRVLQEYLNSETVNQMEITAEKVDELLKFVEKTFSIHNAPNNYLTLHQRTVIKLINKALDADQAPYAEVARERPVEFLNLITTQAFKYGCLHSGEYIYFKDIMATKYNIRTLLVITD